jgi:uncharacterized protein YjcR
MSDVYATAKQIAGALKVPMSTVHRWASEDGWNRDATCRPVLYLYEDACEAFGRRQAARAETLAGIETGRARRLAS